MRSLFRFRPLPPSKRKTLTRLFDEMTKTSVKTTIITMPTAVYRNRAEMDQAREQVKELQQSYFTARREYNALRSKLGRFASFAHYDLLRRHKHELKAHDSNMSDALYYLNYHHWKL